MPVQREPTGPGSPFRHPGRKCRPSNQPYEMRIGCGVASTTLGLLTTLRTAASATSRDMLVSPDNRVLYVTKALGRVLNLDATSGNILSAVPVPAGSLNFMDLTRD